MQKRKIIPELKAHRFLILDSRRPSSVQHRVSKALLSFVVIVAFGLGSSAAFALDLMGPPASGVRQGQFHIGADYSYSQMDLELKDGIWIEYLDGAFNNAGDATSFTLKDFQSRRIYASFGYGIADNWDVFVRLGGTDAQFGDSIWEDHERFDSGAQVAIGGGVRATFYEEGSLKLGALLQVSWAEFDGELKAPHWTAGDSVEMDFTEVQIAVGPTCRLTDRLSIYGGPFLHFVDGDLDDVYSKIDEATGGLLNSHYSWRVQEDSILGAYIGAQVDLAENCSLNIECQLTSAAEAICLGLLWRF
jgi:hypothetical protein